MIDEKEKTGNKARSRWIGRAVAAIMTFWIGSVIILEILLSTSIVTNTVNRIAGRYIDGEISFGKVSASLLKKFPSVTFSFEDFCITYPSDRYDVSENDGPQGALMFRGCGEDADTLATFSSFTASVRVTPLIFGQVKIPEISLKQPVIYAHSYPDGNANWDIFITEDSNEDAEDETAEGLPEISIHKIQVSDNSQIVYTDGRDTVFALVELKQAGFDGRLTIGKASGNRIGLSIDSLFVAGRIASDTLALGLDRLRIHEHDDHMDVDMQAKTLIATHTFGITSRLKSPPYLWKVKQT